MVLKVISDRSKGAVKILFEKFVHEKSASFHKGFFRSLCGYGRHGAGHAGHRAGGAGLAGQFRNQQRFRGVHIAYNEIELRYGCRIQHVGSLVNRALLRAQHIHIHRHQFAGKRRNPRSGFTGINGRLQFGGFFSNAGGQVIHGAAVFFVAVEDFNHFQLVHTQLVYDAQQHDFFQ